MELLWLGCDCYSRICLSHQDLTLMVVSSYISVASFCLSFQVGSSSCLSLSTLFQCPLSLVFVSVSLRWQMEMSWQWRWPQSCLGSFIPFHRWWKWGGGGHQGHVPPPLPRQKVLHHCVFFISVCLHLKKKSLEYLCCGYVSNVHLDELFRWLCIMQVMKYAHLIRGRLMKLQNLVSFRWSRYPSNDCEWIHQ